MGPYDLEQLILWRLAQLESPNIYDLRFEQAIASGLTTPEAAITVTEAYLDGKPTGRGKLPVKAADRNAAFWTSQFLASLSAEVYETEPLILALARYLGQEYTANFQMLRHIAQVAPNAVRRAIRYSEIVLRQDSLRWREIVHLAEPESEELNEIVRICHTFDKAYRERMEQLEACRKPLAAMSPLELLTYASFYAFEHLLPPLYVPGGQNPDLETETVWDAINDILIWKLQHSTDEAFQLTEAALGRSLRAHLSPFLYPSSHLPRVEDPLYPVFGRLVDAQVELNRFMTRSVEAFCYDDTIHFALTDGELTIVDDDPAARGAWKRNGERLARLQNYWFYRAWNEFVESGMAAEPLGRPENQEGNQLAFVKALRTQLQLAEVYGLDEWVLAETGLQVNLFQALLSLELMTAFYQTDFVLPYGRYLSETGHWRQALARLAMGGLIKGLQNRFPITWSERKTKIENLRPWTASRDFPQGHAKAAEAILDFWTSDLGVLSFRLRSGGPGLKPELFERPILKMGQYVFQLPWMVALQNNASAAINNLRRIGARRVEAGEETRRIERRLAKRFEDRGFRVYLNYQPARTFSEDPGEIDLICVRDGQLLVLEIKSTFLRRSLKDTWLHKTTTLRQAGLKLRRKLEAVKAALTSDANLVASLGVQDGIPVLRGWIVDTSIEHDHEYFSGFLKVSLEEILIALRDDKHLLNDPMGLFSGKLPDARGSAPAQSQDIESLYPEGFSGTAFIAVIEQQCVWAAQSASPPLPVLRPVNSRGLDTGIR